MDPDTLLGVRQICGTPARPAVSNRPPRPAVAPLIPASPSTWYEWVNSGVMPKPIKIGGRSFWRWGDIRERIKERQGEPG